MEYRVIWSIGIDAADAKEAAQEAEAVMKDPESIAVVFDVIPAHHENVKRLNKVLAESATQVDLLTGKTIRPSIGN